MNVNFTTHRECSPNQKLGICNKKQNLSFGMNISKSAAEILSAYFKPGLLSDCVKFGNDNLKLIERMDDYCDSFWKIVFGGKNMKKYESFFESKTPMFVEEDLYIIPKVQNIKDVELLCRFTLLDGLRNVSRKGLLNEVVPALRKDHPSFNKVVDSILKDGDLEALNKIVLKEQAKSPQKSNKIVDFLKKFFCGSDENIN